MGGRVILHDFAGWGRGRWRGPAWIPRETPRRGMHFYEYRSVRYWSKEINGARTGGRKKVLFFIRDVTDEPVTMPPGAASFGPLLYDEF